MKTAEAAEGVGVLDKKLRRSLDVIRNTGRIKENLDRLFSRGTLTGLAEDELLKRFVNEGDQSAFATIVKRHGPMVLGVCRRTLRDERDVEDAFQATFLILVRRARTIRDGRLIGRWLHGVAHRVTVRSRAQAARRYVHERPIADEFESVGDSSLQIAEETELLGILDEELGRLPGSLRSPMILCYLEGLTHDEAASRLGWPVGTVRSRMARARELLRRRLSRRGVMASGAVLPGSLPKTTVPLALIDSTVRVSLTFLTKQSLAATVATATATGLANEVIRAMMITRLTVLGATGLSCILTFGGPSLARQFVGDGRNVVQVEQGVEPVQIAQAELPIPAQTEAKAETAGSTTETLDQEAIRREKEARLNTINAELLKKKIDALSKRQIDVQELNALLKREIESAHTKLDQNKLLFENTKNEMIKLERELEVAVNKLLELTEGGNLPAQLNFNENNGPKRGEGIADLVVDVIESRRRVDVGGETSFVIRLRNYGTTKASKLMVTAKLSENLEVLEVAGGPSTNDRQISTKDGDEIRFSEIEGLGPNKEIKLGVRVRVKNAKSTRAYCRVSLNHDNLADSVEGSKSFIVTVPNGSSRSDNDTVQDKKPGKE